MAKTVVTALEDWRKISELSGGDPRIIMHEPATNELECPDVTQPALDAGHAAYTADQTNIDAATQAAMDTVERDNQKENYDVKRVLRAMAEILIDEINTLRTQFNDTTTEVNAVAGSVTVTAFSDRTVAQARAAIRNAIDNL